jgi:hypothetical protein
MMQVWVVFSHYIVQEFFEQQLMISRGFDRICDTVWLQNLEYLSDIFTKIIKYIISNTIIIITEEYEINQILLTPNRLLDRIH